MIIVTYTHLKIKRGLDLLHSSYKIVTVFLEKEITYLSDPVKGMFLY